MLVAARIAPWVHLSAVKLRADVDVLAIEAFLRRAADAWDAEPWLGLERGEEVELQVVRTVGRQREAFRVDALFIPEPIDPGSFFFVGSNGLSWSLVYLRGSSGEMGVLLRHLDVPRLPIPQRADFGALATLDLVTMCALLDALAAMPRSHPLRDGVACTASLDSIAVTASKAFRPRAPRVRGVQ